ncbi:MAG: hypothetical protein ABR881_32175 [Candidatus Sulfotelmatobacter sp.]|jgi:hypothetical protein
MKRESTLHVLKNELKFVQKGGYRAPLVWRAPLVFEDSPTCPKQQCSACPDTNCVLMSFVPTKCRYEAVPCRHIPLNEIGETLDSLYRTGTNEEIEQTLQSWLLETIQQLEEPPEQLEEPSEQRWLEQAA